MSIRRDYYWIVTRDPESGKPFLIFGDDRSAESARQKGLEMLPGVNFEIRKFPTKDLGSASSMLKGRRLENEHSLSRASERLGHDRSVKRLQRRLRSRA